MYEEFFHLKNRPFAPVGPVESFVGVGPLGDALRQLQRALTQGQSIALLIGDNGSGKSHLCKYLAAKESGTHRPVYLSTAGFHTRRALLQAMLYELGESYVGLSEQEARLKLLEAGRRFQASQQKLLLILDEAHLLSPKMYEELRTLIDHAPTGEQQIQLVLAGSMELEEQLFAPELQAFNQRIGAQIVLEPLSMQQSAEYIEARLKWAGGTASDQVFSDDALEMICRASDGNIRCLNQLADHTLLLAYVEELAPATPVHVTAALKDLKALPLQFNAVGLRTEESPALKSLEADDNMLLEDAESESISPAIEPTSSVPVEERDLVGLFGQPEDLLQAEMNDEEEQLEESEQPLAARQEETVAPPSEAPKFSVLEVGAGVEESAPKVDATEEIEAAMDVVEVPAPVAPAVLETAQPAASAETALNDNEMQEFGITDHYAQLDDQFTRADGYLAQLAWSTLPELPAPSLGTSQEYVTGDAEDDYEHSPEEQLLASLQELHQDLDGMIEHRPPASQLRSEPASNFDWLEYDVVQPGIMQDPAWVPEEQESANGVAEASTSEPESLNGVVKDSSEPISAKAECSLPVTESISTHVPTPVEVAQAPVDAETDSDVRDAYELLFDRLRWRRRQQQSRS